MHRLRQAPRGPRALGGAPAAAVAAALVLTAAPAARADDDDLFGIPIVRVALGPAIHMPATATFALDLDVGAGILFGDEGSFAVAPELGYSFDGFGSHAFNLTVGVGAGVPMVYALYQPRLLAGTLTRDDIDDGARHGTVGMRNALGLHMLLDMFSLEVGHQFMSAGGALEHDVHVLIGTNPAAAVFLFGKILDGLR